MYPVAGGTVRMPKKDVLLGGKYLIPKGTTVFLPVRGSPLASDSKLLHQQPLDIVPEVAWFCLESSIGCCMLCGSVQGC